MIELEEHQYQKLKSGYEYAKKIRQMQRPLNRYEITELRKLIKEHIDDGYTNYLRLVSIYSIDRDEYLGIYVRYLYQTLKEL